MRAAIEKAIRQEPFHTKEPAERKVRSIEVASMELPINDTVIVGASSTPQTEQTSSPPQNEILEPDGEQESGDGPVSDEHLVESFEWMKKEAPKARQDGYDDGCRGKPMADFSDRSHLYCICYVQGYKEGLEIRAYNINSSQSSSEAKKPEDSPKPKESPPPEKKKKNWTGYIITGLGVIGLGCLVWHLGKYDGRKTAHEEFPEHPPGI